MKKLQIKKVNLSGICLCGCGKKTKVFFRNIFERGYKKGDSAQYIHGHHSKKMGPEYEINSNGCWIWKKATGCGGYGKKYAHDKTILAHRFYYEKFKGKISKGLCLDHLCKTRHCVNPDHLEPVTQLENNRRGRGTKFNIGIAQEIRLLHKQKLLSHWALAKTYGMSRRNVGFILNNITWKKPEYKDLSAVPEAKA